MKQKAIFLAGGRTGTYGRALLAGAMAVSLCLAVFLVFSGAAQAAPTSATQARTVVENWRRANDEHLGFRGGSTVRSVQTFSDERGTALYYVVYLNPEGYVIVPADDLVEPIIGFVMGDKFDPSPQNPLYALVSGDLPARITYARAHAGSVRSAPDGPLAMAKRKWDQLSARGATRGVGILSDVRVSPMVRTRWSQSTDNTASWGNPCYNYYTPNNYVCGCVATAMAQLMKYHEFPTGPVGTDAFQIRVNGVSQTRRLRGGDGVGGAYNWSQMPLNPATGSTQVQRQAIGALTHDAGVAMNMNYSGGGSGAYTSDADGVYVNVFGYSNAISGSRQDLNIGVGLNGMVNPNLDFGHPVLFGISSLSGGHSIVCDGYGYESTTLYHHLNLGWAGACDAWYNLPNIDVGYDTVHSCVYNVFVTGAGEIISGRVITKDGIPISGAAVTAVQEGGETYTAMTNDAGVYAIGKVPSNATFTFTATKQGWYFPPKTFSTGTSTSGAAVSGNVWGADLDAGLPAYRLQVLSTGVSGVEITGTHGGTADYELDLPKRTSVTLTAPPIHLVAGTDRDYAFLHWTLNGAAQTEEQTSLALTITANVTAAAVYEEIPHLSSVEIIGPTEVDEGSTTAYSCVAHYTTGAVETVTADYWLIAAGECATIDAAGNLTADFVSATDAVLVYAQYTSAESITEFDHLSVGILDTVETTLRVSPDRTVLVPGEPFDIEIQLANAPPFGDMQFDVSFDPSVLELVSDPAKGALVDSYAAGAWPTAAGMNAGGSGAFALEWIGPGDPAKGAGAVVTMQFEFIGDLSALPTEIVISNSSLFDPAAAAMPHVTENGTVDLTDGSLPGGDITVLYPSDAGICLCRGGQCVVTWCCDELLDGNAEVVLVNLDTDESWLLGTAKGPSGALKWTVGQMKSKDETPYPDGENYVVRVTGASGASAKEGVSEAPFTIRSIESIEIEGPATVAENGLAQYNCLAHFSLGADEDVTTIARWKSKSKGGKIDKATGLLTAKEVSQDEPCDISVTLKVGKTKMSGARTVTITNLP
jgi:hypothetical protein